MPRNKAENEFEQSLLDNIRQFGWHCNAVGSTDEGPGFAYTVGVFESYSHAELITFGLPPQDAHRMFSKIIELAKEGRLTVEDRESGLHAIGEAWRFLPLSRNQVEDVALSTLWYYDEDDSPIWQVVWPDADGRFPWETPNANDQPLLGESPPASE